MRYKGSAPFQAFLHSSQGGGVRVRAPEGKDQRREPCATDGEGHKSPGFQDCPNFKYSGLSDHISLLSGSPKSPRTGHGQLARFFKLFGSLRGGELSRSWRRQGEGRKRGKSPFIP